MDKDTDTDGDTDTDTDGDTNGETDEMWQRVKLSCIFLDYTCKSDYKTKKTVQVIIG